MKVGLFGGAFDPPHYGHLFLAEQAREDLELDKVVFVPTGQPAHREISLTESLHRHRMIFMATANNDAFSYDTWEMESDGTSFTITTIERYVEDFPEDELFLIVGADHADLRGWREADTIRDLLKVWSGDRTIHSSSNIRERVRNGFSIRYMLPDDVRGYIELYKLYLPPEPAKTLGQRVMW